MKIHVKSISFKCELYIYKACALFYQWIILKDILIVFIFSDPKDPVHRRNALVF